MANQDEVGSSKSGGLGTVGIILVFIFGVAAGVGGVTFLEGEMSTANEPVPEVEGVSFQEGRVSLGQFDINVHGTNGGRVLRMEISVEVTPVRKSAVEGQIPRLKDGVITLAGDYSYAELEGLDGKNNLRDELIGRLNALLSTPAVQELHFTQFVVQ
jgi:flagellar FliL protein